MQSHTRIDAMQIAMIFRFVFVFSFILISIIYFKEEKKRKFIVNTPDKKLENLYKENEKQVKVNFENKYIRAVNNTKRATEQPWPSDDQRRSDNIRSSSATRLIYWFIGHTRCNNTCGQCDPCI